MIPAASQIEANIRELQEAAGAMTPTERALADALMVTAQRNLEAIEFLRILTNPESVTYDPSYAMVAVEVIKLLDEAGRRACGVHAALVGHLLRSAVH